MRKENYSAEQVTNNEEEASYMLETYIQMVIDEALFNHKKEMLEIKINESLDQKDVASFLTLSKAYKELMC